VYSSEDRVYCYPNSGSLKNLLNIRDAAELAEVEAYVVALRMAEVLRAPIEFTFSYDYLKDLHKRLFRDVYEWAGTTRQVDLSKGDTRFAVWEQIDVEADRLFASTPAEAPAPASDVRRWFVETAAHFLVELNVVHPFREGNGRTMRVFADLWARSIRLRLAWDNVEPDQVLSAMIYGVDHDDSRLREALDQCIEDSW
jgi:cell filamentation protein